MDYNYIRMRNAIKAGDNAAAEKYRRLYEDRQKLQPKRLWPVAVLVSLLVIAAALGTYILIINGGEHAINDPIVTEEPTPPETPAVVTEPEPIKNTGGEGAE